MLFQVISLTLALAPLSMAAACPAGHKHHGMKPKHADGLSSSTDVNPVPPFKGDYVEGEPGNGHAEHVEPVKGDPGKGEPVMTEPGDRHAEHVEPVKGEPGKGYPVKSEPGDGHPEELVASSSKFIGLGTSYGNDCGEEKCWQGGACSFVDYHLPAGIDGSTCVSQEIWNSGANCGGCISVSYKGKTITVMVTNKTDGNSTHLDMTPNTMSKLVGHPAGGIPGIQWQFIECPIPKSSPLTIKVHGGASKYWFAAMVLNSSLRTAAVDVSTDGGQTWMPTTRNSVNMFILGHVLPTDYVWVRATSVTGKKVVVKDVKIESGRSFPAETNY